MKNLIYRSLFLLLLAGSVFAEPVPPQLLKPNLLNLSAGTKYDLIGKSTVSSVTYYLVEQRPPLGDWSYVLIQEAAGKAPVFKANGTAPEVMKRSLPPKAADDLATAYVRHEQGTNKDRSIIPAAAQSEYDKVKRDFPPALRKAYEARGFR